MPPKVMIVMIEPMARPRCAARTLVVTMGM